MLPCSPADARTGAPPTVPAPLPLCARAEIEYRNPYQVRHTFASGLLTAGENPWFVAEQLGHADVTMVFQTYGKFIAKDYQKPTRQPNLKVV